MTDETLSCVGGPNDGQSKRSPLFSDTLITASPLEVDGRWPMHQRNTYRRAPGPPPYWRFEKSETWLVGTGRAAALRRLAT